MIRYLSSHTAEPSLFNRPPDTPQGSRLATLTQAWIAIREALAPARVHAPSLQWQIDWDNDVPPFPVLAGEVARAQAMHTTQPRSSKPLPTYPGPTP